MKPKILCIQFSNKLLNPNDTSTEVIYYNKLYNSRDGYYRMKHTWEIPQWIAQLDYITPVDIYYASDIDTAKHLINWSDKVYDCICFSALDVNYKYIIELSKKCDIPIYVGGYVDKNIFNGYSNIHWCNSIEEFCQQWQLPYKFGVSYRLWDNEYVIPRLSLSDGCLHHCKFCCVPKGIKEFDNDYILNQIFQITKYLKYKLIYINDKTFGQVKNHKLLPYLYNMVKTVNPEFLGFIIQTTATKFPMLSDDILKCIAYVELGIESYNDDILRGMNKPARCKSIDKCMDIAKENKIKVIPNIIIGFPQETVETYTNTLHFIVENKDIISHCNIYNLAIYEGTALSKEVLHNPESDCNENTANKSWNVGKEDLVTWFSDKLFRYSLNQLED